MTKWLYAASKALASQGDTLSLACESGFIWRSFYNVNGAPIACVRDIQPGDDLVLGYRSVGGVRLLARFRIGRPDEPISASPAFGEIPAVWVDEFRRHGYADDPFLGTMVGIFVEECEPLAGHLPYRNQNSLSKLSSDPLAPADPSKPDPTIVATPRLLVPQAARAGQLLSGSPSQDDGDETAAASVYWRSPTSSGNSAGVLSDERGEVNGAIQAWRCLVV